MTSAFSPNVRFTNRSCIYVYSFQTLHKCIILYAVQNVFSVLGEDFSGDMFHGTNHIVGPDV